MSAKQMGMMCCNTKEINNRVKFQKQSGTGSVTGHLKMQGFFPCKSYAPFLMKLSLRKVHLYHLFF